MHPSKFFRPLEPSVDNVGIRRFDESNSRVIDNEQLIRAAFDESTTKGFEALYRIYYQALYSHALRFVYTKEKAEDLVCEVFLNFWNSNSFTAIQGTFRAYLYAAVRKRAYTYIRYELKEEKTVTSFEATEFVPGPQSPQDMIEYDELFQRIEQTIQDLPFQCQRVFILSRFEGKKNQEIANELGLALKTVEAHMARALSQLRKAIWISFYFLSLFH